RISAMRGCAFSRSEASSYDMKASFMLSCRRFHCWSVSSILCIGSAFPVKSVFCGVELEFKPCELLFVVSSRVEKRLPRGQALRLVRSSPKLCNIFDLRPDLCSQRITFFQCVHCNFLSLVRVPSQGIEP